MKKLINTKKKIINTKKKNIVVDQTMQGVETLFGSIANISYCNGRDIHSNLLERADALLCRSITDVGESLLANSSLSFVGTATIGTDHLDIPWLDDHRVDWSNAAGCNAAAVTQYVLSAIAFWCCKRDKDINSIRIGLIGAGNVGTELKNCLDKLEISYKLYDPPKALERDSETYSNFSEVMSCDVITLHVPLVTEGRHQTHHMIGRKELHSLNGSQLLINASRGAVIDNAALSDYLNGVDSADIVLDVFENEPNISEDLVSKCLLATPHIAGHTLEGKLRGTWMIYMAFCKHFDLEITQSESNLYPARNTMTVDEQQLTQNILTIYDIEDDSLKLKTGARKDLAERFDSLRKNATLLGNGQIRRDYSGWNIKSGDQKFKRLFL